MKYLIFNGIDDEIKIVEKSEFDLAYFRLNLPKDGLFVKEVYVSKDTNELDRFEELQTLMNMDAKHNKSYSFCLYIKNEMMLIIDDPTIKKIPKRNVFKAKNVDWTCTINVNETDGKNKSYVDLIIDSNGLKTKFDFYFIDSTDHTKITMDESKHDFLEIDIDNMIPSVNQGNITNVYTIYSATSKNTRSITNIYHDKKIKNTYIHSVFYNRTINEYFDIRIMLSAISQEKFYSWLTDTGTNAITIATKGRFRLDWEEEEIYLMIFLMTNPTTNHKYITIQKIPNEKLTSSEEDIKKIEGYFNKSFRHIKNSENCFNQKEMEYIIYLQ